MILLIGGSLWTVDPAGLHVPNLTPTSEVFGGMIPREIMEFGFLKKQNAAQRGRDLLISLQTAEIKTGD